MATKKTTKTTTTQEIEQDAAPAAPKERKARTPRTKRAQAAPEPTPEPEAKAEPERAQGQDGAPEAKGRKRKPKGAQPAVAGEPWNPTVALQWEDDELPSWTGSLAELVATNAQGEESDPWGEELVRDLRGHGQHKGGGGAAPAYTIRIVETEPIPDVSPQAIHERTIADLPEPPAPPDTRPANVTSATLLDAATGFLVEIEAEGASEATVSGYSRELKVALEHFGERTLLCSLSPRKVQNYFESDAVMIARDGSPKAEPSWQRTRRVLRLALVWAQDQGLVEKAPLPEGFKRARKAQESKASAS